MKNLEIKKEIKKMSLANIDGKLTPEEMENIMAGSGITKDCAMAIGNFALGLAGIVALGIGTAGVGVVAIAALGGLSGAIGMSACRK